VLYSEKKIARLSKTRSTHHVRRAMFARNEVARQNSRDKISSGNIGIKYLV